MGTTKSSSNSVPRATRGFLTHRRESRSKLDLSQEKRLAGTGAPLLGRRGLNFGSKAARAAPLILGSWLVKARSNGGTPSRPTRARANAACPANLVSLRRSLKSKRYCWGLSLTAARTHIAEPASGLPGFCARVGNPVNENRHYAGANRWCQVHQALQHLGLVRAFGIGEFRSEDWKCSRTDGPEGGDSHGAGGGVMKQTAQLRHRRFRR